MDGDYNSGAGPQNNPEPTPDPEVLEPLKTDLFIDLSYKDQGLLITLNFNTSLGFKYDIEASNDLKKWSKIQTINGTGQKTNFTDNRNAFFDEQYYRIIVSN